MRATLSSWGYDAKHLTSRELTAAIQPIKKAAKGFQLHVDRFAIYNVLEALYRVHIDWKQQKAVKQRARLLANRYSIARRKGMSPIRVLIEATLPNAHFKQKSRWVRALEYVAYEGIPVERFRRFVRANGGLAGCARLAASTNRKRRRPGGDWNDDDQFC